MDKHPPCRSRSPGGGRRDGPGRMAAAMSYRQAPCLEILGGSVGLKRTFVELAAPGRSVALHQSRSLTHHKAGTSRPPSPGEIGKHETSVQRTSAVSIVM